MVHLTVGIAGTTYFQENATILLQTNGETKNNSYLFTQQDFDIQAVLNH